MFREKRRYGQDPLNVHISSKATFDAPLKWQREVERGERQGEGRLVFTCSWSDWFIREADAWRDNAWAIIRACPDLIFQVLTKRSDRIFDHTPWANGSVAPWPNVWLGVSVENQELADLRIPDLVRVPAHVRFLSCEPLLGEIDVRPWIGSLHQIITGGESGDEPGVEPTHPQWVRLLRDQCIEAGIAFHHKQWGEWVPWVEGVGPSPFNRPAGFFDKQDRWYPGEINTFRQSMVRVGKKASGRTLDGREWNEFPALESATS